MSKRLGNSATITPISTFWDKRKIQFILQPFACITSQIIRAKLMNASQVLSIELRRLWQCFIICICTSSNYGLVVCSYIQIWKWSNHLINVINEIFEVSKLRNTTIWIVIIKTTHLTQSINDITIHLITSFYLA